MNKVNLPLPHVPALGRRVAQAQGQDCQDDGSVPGVHGVILLGLAVVITFCNLEGMEDLTILISLISDGRSAKQLTTLAPLVRPPCSGVRARRVRLLRCSAVRAEATAAWENYS